MVGPDGQPDSGAQNRVTARRPRKRPGGWQRGCGVRRDGTTAVRPEPEHAHPAPRRASVVVTAVITTFVVHWTTRRFVEDAIGDQMVMQARIVAHLVAIAEQQATGGDDARGDQPPPEGDRPLREGARELRLRVLGHRQLRQGVPGHGGHGVHVQAGPAAGGRLPAPAGRPAATTRTWSCRRAASARSTRFVYKYVGVSGVDRPRIVQVGYRTDSCSRSWPSRTPC